MRRELQTIEEREILSLGNGSRVEVSVWAKDKKSFYGRVLDINPSIFVYLPISYLATNVVKTPKKKYL